MVGAGVFGRNHLRIWRALEDAGAPVRLVAIVEPNASAATSLASEFRVPVYNSTSDLLRSTELPDAASITVPTSDHASVASELLSAGVDVLVEKPFTATLQQADELIDLAQRHKRIVQVGHLERFNPAVRAVRSILHQPLFFEVHRLSVFTPRALDVDVVLDLMIHDLDIVLSFVDSPVREIRAVGLPVLSRKVDIANVRLEFENGCIANFTASRVSTERVRKLRFFQPHQYLSLDFARQDLLMIDVTAAAGLDPVELATMTQTAGQHPSAGLSLTKVPVEQGEPLRLEIESFLNSVRTRTAPLVSGEDGRAALALALEINRAIAAHAERTGL